MTWEDVTRSAGSADCTAPDAEAGSNLPESAIVNSAKVDRLSAPVMPVVIYQTREKV